MLLTWSRLSILVIVLFAACDTAPGERSVRFNWVDPPAAGTTLYLTLEVQRRPDLSVEGPVLAATPPTAIKAGVPIATQLKGVPNGDGIRVIAEVRAALGPGQRALYYGISEPFSLAPGKTDLPSLDLDLHRPETERNNTVGLRFPAGVGVPSLTDITTSTVVLTTAKATVIELGNDPTLGDSTRIDVASECVPEGEQSVCEVTYWNLARGATVDGGIFTVYARFVDRNGYPSETIPAQVRADAEPPKVLLAAALPAFGRPGGKFLLSVTTNEPVAAPELIVIPATGLVLPPPETVDATTWTWRGEFQEELIGGEAFAFEIVLEDLAKNSSERLALETVPGLPLQVTVDAEPPLIVLDDLLIAGAGLERLGPDERFHLTGDDALELEVRSMDEYGLAGLLGAKLGPYDFDCVSKTGTDTVQTHTCGLTIPTNAPDSFDGTTFITISEVDLAGNLGLTSAFAVVVDRVGPEVIAETWLDVAIPPGIGLGATTRLELAWSERVIGAPSVTIGDVTYLPASMQPRPGFIIFEVGPGLAAGVYDGHADAHDRATNLGRSPLLTLTVLPSH
ncbi:MAG: hypothetical protein ACI9MR_002046 [Myxococcota bacterium]|jgi:hypothetical protein